MWIGKEGGNWVGSMVVFEKKEWEFDYFDVQNSRIRAWTLQHRE